ncbi:MAG: helix-turn-helix transcriptional regulator [Armatimonadetes bacterium]|nr:helix-turn-helix transcriptional regulator [Armatimonadota bacterium]
MVKCFPQELDQLFSALGEPVRRSVVRSLATGEKSLSALAEPFSMTMPAVMKHVAVLERSGLVRSEKRGRTRYCSLEPARLKEAQDWIAETVAFWTPKLESLARHLEASE